jgi:hypothetical protein
MHLSFRLTAAPRSHPRMTSRRSSFSVPRPAVLWLWVDSVFFGVICCCATSHAGTIEFNRDIRPVFSDTCFKCHGFDKQARKGDLRLDLPEDAFAAHKKGTPIVPGRPEQSEAIKRLMSDDPDVIMPPADSKLAVTAAQKELIRRWVAEGAHYQPQWAFIPPAVAPVPEVTKRDWVRNPIDQFILARLEAAGLSPSAEADRRTLIRRVSFDLTGLPPTPAETEAFVSDTAPDAYEKVVDRLLASPHYGERMAADWLDLARFADTHGYQADRYRAMWPYRDWVIKAFNDNLPFDQFGTWQLAGDLLPNATKEQRLATAFNRLHMQNEEGGVVEEEFRVAYVNDRVDTYGTTFLGLTVGCAHCHDHKFDPITQKDFYSLFAFFQNIDESGQTSYFTGDTTMPVPTLLLSSQAQDQQLAKLHAQIDAKQKQIDGLAGAEPDGFNKWLSSRHRLPPEPAGLIGRFDFKNIEAGDKLPNASDASKPGIAVEKPQLVNGIDDGGAALSGENGFRFPGLGHFNRADPFSFSLRIEPPVAAPRLVVFHCSKAPIDAGSRGYEMLLEDGHVAFALHHMWPGNSLKVRTKNTLTPGQWTHITITYDGSSRAEGVKIYENLRPPDELDVIRDGLFKDITYGGDEPDLAIGYRFRDNGFKDGRVADFAIFNRELTALEAGLLGSVSDGNIDWTGLLAGSAGASAAWKTPANELTPADRRMLRDYYNAVIAPETSAAVADLHNLRDQERTLIEPIPEVMVMQELPHPKQAFILKRGQYDAHGDEVFAATPGSLPPFPADQPHNRLGLARWTFSPLNPLTSRVEVNRLWQQMFGRGLVPTSENFGSQGTFPTHPELLDWLARNLADNGWNVKQMMRLIALSATYRQASRATDEMNAIDPTNELLAHAPPRRLTAEMLRDQALDVSGLLVDRIGGPSVRPYQPEHLWDVAMGNPAYNQGHGDDLHRRSLYTLYKRTVPPPSMVIFDAADRSYCTARRQSTSTPLQALALLDDVQITEASRLVSQRMLNEGGDSLDGRIAFVFHLMTSQQASEKEADILRRLFSEQRAMFAADPESAKKLLAVGEAKTDPSLDVFDLAAGTVLAEALFNFDDAMMRR